MPVCCAVSDCSNTSTRCGDLSYYRFPAKNEKLCKEWISLCRRKIKIGTKHSRICSVHFTPEDFERDLRNELLGLPIRKKLLKGAVPSIFPGRSDEKSEEKVAARKERKKKREWDRERKAIVQELLNRMEAEEQEAEEGEQDYTICVDYNQTNLTGPPSADDFFETDDQKWEPPPARTPTPPPPEPEPEPEYFELTIDDFRKKVDSLWKVLLFKNKKISSLERRIEELEKVLKQNQLHVTWIVPETQQDELHDPLGEDESEKRENSGCTSKEVEDSTSGKAEEKAASVIENSLEEFCRYNNIHLQTLDLIKSEVGKTNLVEECRTKTPRLTLERLEHSKEDLVRGSKISFINDSCSSPVELEMHGDDETMPSQELPMEVDTKWVDSVKKGLYSKYSYRCNKCMEVCTSLEAILLHNREKHKQPAKKAVQSCSHCKTSCGNGKYDDHLRYRRERKATQASFVRFVRKVYPPPSDDPSSSQPVKRMWKCDKCEETFAHSKDKTRHRQEVHGRFAKKWKCGSCEEVFAARYKLQVHMKEAHRESLPNRWKCEECEEAFPTMKSRILHMREQHKAETLPEKNCPHCNRVIRGRYQYKLHIQRHVGERPFLCSQCGFQTKSKSQLKHHTENIHVDNGAEGSHICMYCGRSYKSKSGLLSHERVHNTKYTCPICKKIVGAGLKTHIDLVHNMIRKFKCHLCEKTYKTSSHLNDHLARTHKQPHRTRKCNPDAVGGATPRKRRKRFAQKKGTPIQANKELGSAVNLAEASDQDRAKSIQNQEVQEPSIGEIKSENVDLLC